MAPLQLKYNGHAFFEVRRSVSRNLFAKGLQRIFPQKNNRKFRSRKKDFRASSRHFAVCVIHEVCKCSCARFENPRTQVVSRVGKIYFAEPRAQFRVFGFWLSPVLKMRFATPRKTISSFLFLRFAGKREKPSREYLEWIFCCSRQHPQNFARTTLSCSR